MFLCKKKKTLEGSGLRDSDLTKAFARMVIRKLVSQSKTMKWPISAEELIKQLGNWGPLKCIYNALAWSEKIPLPGIYFDLMTQHTSIIGCVIHVFYFCHLFHLFLRSHGKNCQNMELHYGGVVITWCGGQKLAKQ